MLECENKFLSKKEEFELREVRLKMVYSVLYVLATIWIVIFLCYVKVSDSSGFIYCTLLSFSTTFIVFILSYVFKELQCLKIYKDVSNDDKQAADISFSNIWKTVIYAGYIFAFVSFVYKLITSYCMNIWILISFFIIAIISEFISYCIKKHNKFSQLVLFMKTLAVDSLCCGVFCIYLLPQ